MNDGRASLRMWWMLGGAAWFAAGIVLSTRCHFVYHYVVTNDGVLEPWRILVLFAAASVIFVGAVIALRLTPDGGAVGSPSPRPQRAAIAWLLSCIFIPVLDSLRRAGCLVPATFFEPLYFSFVTGVVAWFLAASFERQDGQKRRWFHRDSQLWTLLMATVAIAIAAWWYFQASQAYDDYQLGYPDFADYGRRVANTFEGRGFLSKSPLWPRFYDHYQPGLALLVPLWGVWPDARMFFLLQAVCLAMPALFIFGWARQFGAEKAAAAAWACSYLFLPAVGQLNLSFSYGFHPVSLALPVVTVAIWAAFARRRFLALSLAIVACSFEESVFVALAGISLSLAVVEWKGRDSRSGLTGLPARIWFAVATCFAVGFVAVVKMANLTQGTLTWRFQNLGSSPWEAALSPLIRPGVFWSQIFRTESLYFALTLFVPAGLISVIRGWPALIGLTAPLIVLLTWSVDGSTCIAFQYVTLLLPCVVLAAMLGARGMGEKKSADSTAFRLFCVGIASLASSATASLFLGALPMSGTTTTFSTTSEERAATSSHREALDQAVRLAGSRDDATLASCRLAAHLLAVRRLEDVNFTLRKVDALSKEVGPGRRWIECFDWIALDLTDRNWNHTIGDLMTVAFEAESAGYPLAFADHGVLVYRRPEHARALHPAANSGDALQPWRISSAETAELVRNHPAPKETYGLRVLKFSTIPHAGPPGTPASLDVEIILQASQDFPAECCFRCTWTKANGTTAAESGFRLPAGGNRPTSWWKKGEAWRDRFSVRFVQGAGKDEMRGTLEVVSLESRDAEKEAGSTNQH